MKNLYKYPRLYVNEAFEKDQALPLSAEQAHYLKNVLRRTEGDTVRVFNGRDGEWLADITKLGKKDGIFTLIQRIRAQDSPERKVHLLFAPIKKQRMDFLVEKAVELGVTDMHPVQTDRTENRKLNEQRIKAQIVEAAEQCERLDIPVLHSLVTLPQKIKEWKNGVIYACLERIDAPPLHTIDGAGDIAFLIGPEGGFDPQEIAALEQASGVTPVSLGCRVLRAETASLACLSYASLNKKQ